MCKEITLDFANNMSSIVKRCFPCAKEVNDRFHLHKLVYDAVQEMRIKYRWEALDAENKAIKKAKEEKKKYEPERFENGDTLKQLLARGRYALYKSPNKWSKSQKERAHLMFKLYPDLKKAYLLSMQLKNVFSAKSKEGAYLKLARWYNDVEIANFESFNTCANTIMNHYETILNYFDNRSTHVSAESFNAKIKSFRATFRGVSDITFFLYRLSTIFG